MLVEILVLGGEERVDDHLGDRLDRQIEAAFLGVFAEKGAVGGVDARHDGRLVVLQLRIVGQVLGEMPDQAGGGGDTDEEDHSSGCEQETQKPHEQAHYDVPF